MARSFFVLLILLAASSCSKPQEPEAPRLFAEDQYADRPNAPPQENVDMPLTELSRREVNETVDGGLGRFLQEVHLVPSFVEGRFQGFLIVEFAHPEKWVGTGLRPGDVITSVNGQSIERPDQGYAVFVGLKTASHLEVTYLRNGTEMRLSLPIVDRAQQPSAAPSEAPRTPSPNDSSSNDSPPTDSSSSDSSSSDRDLEPAPEAAGDDAGGS